MMQQSVQSRASARLLAAEGSDMMLWHVLPTLYRPEPKFLTDGIKALRRPFSSKFDFAVELPEE